MIDDIIDNNDSNSVAYPFHYGLKWQLCRLLLPTTIYGVVSIIMGIIIIIIIVVVLCVANTYT